jgi:Kae1-associated kinase Bud32
MSTKVIAQGAEAKIILSNNFVIKDRIKKSYRIPILDERIRKLRTRSEKKLLEKASKIINVPSLEKSEDHTKIKMEYIEGNRLSEFLDLFKLERQKEICIKIGQEISKLHDSSIIHGDLTTSNIILVEDKVSPNWKIFFIDFGLGYISKKTEDKAVDLHLLKQALEAKHFKHWEALWKEVEKGYKNSKESKKILERLKAVEKRGRYKDKY